MKKATLADIAREAGVGTATVERVLNSRGNVTPATIEKVVQAMRQLGSTRALPQKYSGVLRVEVLMVRRETPFFTRLNEAFIRISESLDPSILLHRTFVDENAPASVAQRIAEPGFRRVGLIIVAPDHPEVRARLAQEREKGVAIVQIVSRIDGSHDHEPGRAGLEHERLVVAVAGLRTRVADEAHAEGMLVEVRALRGVAGYEDDRVHGGDGERVTGFVVLDQPDELLESFDGEVGFALFGSEVGSRHTRSVLQRAWTRQVV